MEHHIRYDAATAALHLLDQRLLPTKECSVVCTTTAHVIDALKVMVVRGAPALGVTAAFGCLLALREHADAKDWQNKLHTALDALACARPTAVNLAWAVARMRVLWHEAGSAVSPKDLNTLWQAAAFAMQREDIAVNKAIGMHGASLLKDGDTIMTHCNAGALATAGYGTALAPVRAARAQGKHIDVIANETRPFLQGARLTAYELAREGIPVTVACDNAVGLLMQKGLVHCVIVGADRIAANGDTANKIGTYTVAVLAREHGLPFYVAAPLSTIDSATPDGGGIPIEERPAREVTHIGAAQITPDNVPVYNFAFDISPAHLIHGIITEKGVLRPPYSASIANAKLCENRACAR